MPRSHPAHYTFSKVLPTLASSASHHHTAQVSTDSFGLKLSKSLEVAAAWTCLAPEVDTLGSCIEMGHLWQTVAIANSA